MSTQEEITSVKSLDNNTNSKKRDKYCWICHTYEEIESIVTCNTCPRVYHNKCLNIPQTDEHTDGLQEPKDSNEWTCYECQRVKIEDLAQTTLKQVNEDQFYAMLNSAVKRLKYAASEPFQKEVDPVLFPLYHEYVIHPMDISQMEKKIELKQYVSLESVAQDTKWIVHNCTIFNGSQNKLTSVAKSLFKMIKHELSEIDVCADCYLSSISKNNEQWFTEPCRTPHPLVFAKIKGFPYWPAKALKAIGTSELDVRFFGAHDRSLVSIDKCYWLSKELPANVRNHTMVNMQPSLQELNTHIKKLEQKFGPFRYAPPVTPIDLNAPFVFIDAFKDINCLPTMSENNRILTRKRNYTNNLNTSLSNTTTPTLKVEPPQQSLSTTPTTTPTHATRPRKSFSAPTSQIVSTTTPNESILRRRSGRTIKKESTSEMNTTNETVDDSSIILIDDELEKMNSNQILATTTTACSSIEDVASSAQQTINEDDSLNTSTRSKRLRKISNKYSNYSVETLTPSNSTKRKSSRVSLVNSESVSNATTPTNTVSSKKLRSDSDSKSATSIIFVPNTNQVKQSSVNKTSSISSTRSSSTSGHIDSDNNTETDLTNKLNDDDNESTVSSSFSSDLDRDKRKDLKRKEKHLRKEIISSEANEENNSSSCSTTATASSIVVKLPRYNLNNTNEDSSSLLVSSSSSSLNTQTMNTTPVSPIKIKISRNQDDKSKLSSYSIDSSDTKPATPTNTITDNKPNIILNLGELVRKKSSVTLNELASSPVAVATTPTQPLIEETIDESIKPIEDQTQTESKEEQVVENNDENKDIEMVSNEDLVKPVEKEEKSNDLIENKITEKSSNEVIIESENKKNHKTDVESVKERELVIENEQEQDIQMVSSENSDSGLEPGEVVRTQALPQVMLNGQQQNMTKKPILSNTLNTSSSSQTIASLQQQQQTTKFKKIAPALSNNMNESIPAILLATASNFNILNTQQVNTVSPNKSKREIELEKLVEEKTTNIKEMKQFYEKLLREIKHSNEQQQHQLIREIKYNCDLKISEILKESSKKEIKLKADFERRITETKMKQWCACCGKEAIYYCCWNTSYCDEDCQKRHWGQHLKICTRIQNESEMNEPVSHSFTTNGTGYNNNDNTNFNGLYNQFNQRPKQQQHNQQKPVHIHQQSSHYQTFNPNVIQKKILPNNTNQNNFGNNNNNNRKVTL